MSCHLYQFCDNVEKASITVRIEPTHVRVNAWLSRRDLFSTNKPACEWFEKEVFSTYEGIKDRPQVLRVRGAGFECMPVIVPPSSADSG